MTERQQAYKLEIRNEQEESISFTPRLFGDVGRDIVAIKLALGVILDMGGILQQNREEVTNTQPLDENGWFDCTTGKQISLELAATFDSKMQTSLINYQIKNQFLIMSYLFGKYGVPGIINAVGEDYTSESEEELLEYLVTIVAQVDSITTLFDSELGTLGEATLAVMHGWVPHTVAGNRSYHHSEALRMSMMDMVQIYDILPYTLISFLNSGNLGQTAQDLIESNLVLEGQISEQEVSGRSAELSYYLNTVPEDKRWISISSIPNFSYGYVGYKIIEPGETSILHRSTMVTLENYKNQKFNERIAPGSETTDKLRKVFYPDPFSTTDLFYINEHVSGFYFETEYTLSAEGPLPKEDRQSISSIEEQALQRVLEISNKPDIWYLRLGHELTDAVTFGAAEPGPYPHDGIFPLPSAEQGGLTGELKEHIPRFSSIRARINEIKEEMRQVPSAGQGFGETDEVNQTRYSALSSSLGEQEQLYAQEPTPEELRENFLVLGTTTGIESAKEKYPESSNPATHWREVDNVSTQKPLIRFVEYKTPSLRPGQTYRALMEVSNRKLELIANGVSRPSPAAEASESPESEAEEFCLNEDTTKTLRTLQEYRSHARKKRREIVRQLRDKLKESPELKQTNTITGGQIGPFDIDRAMSDLMGFDMNGVSDYEYTKGVLSRLGDVGTAALTSLGVLNTDIDHFNKMANDSNKELTKEDAKGKPILTLLKITVEEFDERIKTITKDLQESSQIIASEGIAFKNGSDFNAKKEAGLLTQFSSQFKELLFESAEEAYGKKVSQLMRSNPGKTTITVEFKTQLAPGKNPHMGPKFGKRIVGFGLQLPEDFKKGKKFWPFLEKKPSEFKGPSRGPALFLEPRFAKTEQIKDRKEKIKKSKVLSRGRTVNYIQNIREMTGATTDKPNEIVSIFDDGRGSCKDLGINMEKKQASSYIAKHTTGVQVEHPAGDPSGFSWKKFAKDNFVDPATSWVNTSSQNWENSWNDSFDESAALKMLGDMCTLEDLYKEFFDKLDLVSLFCDWLKCIRLPNFDLKLPNFYLPPLPTIPILGWYAALIRFLIDNIKQILIRIMCTFVRTIIDKLAIPFCEEQLRDFIAAGSLSGSPLMNQALADALVNTGIPAEKKEEAKDFFDDVANITTGEELCHLLAGKPLDDASMAMINRLLEKNNLSVELGTTEDVLNYFDLLGTLMPAGICEELSKSKTLAVPKNCVEISDYLQDIRNRLQTGDSTLTDDEIDRVVQMAKDEHERKKDELKAFSGNNIGDLLPQAYGPGNPDAIISSYPDFLKKELETTVKNSFATARDSYVKSMDAYIPSLSINMPSTPRAGFDNYSDIQMLNFEASLTQLSMYATGMQRSAEFALREAAHRLGLPPDADEATLNNVITKGPILHKLAIAATSWIKLHIKQMSHNHDPPGGDNHTLWLNGDGAQDGAQDGLPGLSPLTNSPGGILSNIEFTDKIRLTSTNGGSSPADREGIIRVHQSPGVNVANPFIIDEDASPEEQTEQATLLIKMNTVIERAFATWPTMPNPQSEITDIAWILQDLLFTQAFQDSDYWDPTGVEPFILSPIHLEFLEYIMERPDDRIQTRRNLFVELERDPSQNPADIVIAILNNTPSIVITEEQPRHYFKWHNYHTRILNEVHNKEHWTPDYQRGDNIEPFIEPVKNYRVRDIDDTIRKLKAIIREYMSKTGFRPQMNPTYMPFDGHSDYIPDDYTGPFAAQTSHFFKGLVEPAKHKGPEEYNQYYWAPFNPLRRNEHELWWRHQFSNKCRNELTWDGECEYRSWRYFDYLWHRKSHTGHGSGLTEGLFVDNFIEPTIRSENEGVEWNHELRSLEVLKVLANLTEADFDPYIAAVDGARRAAGVSWYNSLLLYSVFETEEVPLESNRAKTHKVFKKARLPIVRDQNGDNWGPSGEFISYYRRPMGIGTVNDYVDGERVYVYVDPDNSLPFFEQKGAVYKGVFNKLTDENPFPLEVQKVSYDEFYESTTDPTDKTEFSLILPSYVPTLNAFEEDTIQDYFSESWRLRNQLHARFRPGSPNFDPEANELVESIGLENFRHNYITVLSVEHIADDPDDTILEYLIESRDAAIRYIDNLERIARARYYRDRGVNNRSRIDKDRIWHGQDAEKEHYNFIKDSIRTQIENVRYFPDELTGHQNNTAFIPRGVVLLDAFITNRRTIERSPQYAYKLLRNYLTAPGGSYSVLDPAVEILQRDGAPIETPRIVPIFPISMTNSGLKNEGKNWLIHSYEVITAMGLEVLGGTIAKEIILEELDQEEEDLELSEDQYSTIFSDYYQAIRFDIRPEFVISRVCKRLEGTINNPKLVRFVNRRIKELTDTITSAIEHRPVNLSDEHLVMLKSVLEKNPIVHRYEDQEENKDKRKLVAEFGTYHPQVIFTEKPHYKQYDRYSVEIRSDFHLRQPNETYSANFEMCETLPESLILRNSTPADSQGNPPKYFSKREGFANIVISQIQKHLSGVNFNGLKPKIYSNLYYSLRDDLFAAIASKISNSKLFDIDYATEVDARLSAEPVFHPGNRCVRNRYGLVEAAVISFNDVILQESYEEIMKETSKPENSPFNRDFDDPTPIDLALQSISLKAFVRVCLVDTLLKGGMAYSVWDIEPIVSNSLFKKYAFEHVHRELQSDHSFSKTWKNIIEKTVGVTNPKVALRLLVEEELTKLPDYSKQVFNFQSPDEDYYNWHLNSGQSGINVYDPWLAWDTDKNMNQISAELAHINARGGDTINAYEELLRIIAEQEGEDTYVAKSISNLVNDPENLEIQQYVKLSGEIVTNAVELIEQVRQNYGDELSDPTLDALADRLGSTYTQHASVQLDQNTLRRFSTQASEISDFLRRSSLYYPPSHETEDNFYKVSANEDYLVSLSTYDTLILTLYHGLTRQQFLEVIKNSKISHGARLSLTTDDTYMIEAVKQDPDIRRKSYLHGSFLSVAYETQRDGDEPTYLVAKEILTIPLVECEHQLKLDDCGAPSGDMFAHHFLSSPTAGVNVRRPVHVDFVRDLLYNDTQFINIVEHVFPLRRFMAISSIFATGMISGYNGMPTLLDPVKSSIGFVAKVATTPASRQLDLVSISPEQFSKTVVQNWPSHDKASDCFEFPALPGWEFFKKFFEDLWKLIKMLPSILFRGIANQLDPAYKEMRQHYLNCEIEHLTWKGLDISSADHGKYDGLVNGLLYKDGNIQGNLGDSQAKYIPILPGLIFDELISRANLLMFNPYPLGRTIARTVTYAYSGMAPFLDLSRAFSVPCAGYSQEWDPKGKYDMGAYGRYGHPLSPFTILALSTYQLESDKRLKRPNCINYPENGRKELATYNECDE